MGNYYEINVALNGKHFFATAPRSITTEDKMLRVFKTFKEKFPEREGYSVDVSYWSSTGQIVTPSI